MKQQSLQHLRSIILAFLVLGMLLSSGSAVLAWFWDGWYGYAGYSPYYGWYGAGYSYFPGAFSQYYPPAAVDQVLTYADRNSLGAFQASSATRIFQFMDNQAGYGYGYGQYPFNAPTSRGYRYPSNYNSQWSDWP